MLDLEDQPVAFEGKLVVADHRSLPGEENQHMQQAVHMAVLAERPVVCIEDKRLGAAVGVVEYCACDMSQGGRIVLQLVEEHTAQLACHQALRQPDHHSLSRKPKQQDLQIFQ